jgi:hypothetical protein
MKPAGAVEELTRVKKAVSDADCYHHVEEMSIVDESGAMAREFYCIRDEKYVSTSSAKRSCPLPSTRVSETFL